ncbi:PREDICTED: uncharacterized protein LOC107187045 [Dufourea novaeangliae]|uniref:Deltamethrin resistance protein prag01 domain-containing protein n=1 Tax=Dufourea novaeangliae TaxID=178035 RepID=A0A154NXH0_DUFNO|nr:PREDICTED: uncharacterized protein LOC107187045 [Dufourea novaeangliae]KZC04262.1 hypothetical protein WN55_02151 [Dufourea novaeangliae]
MFRHLVRPVVQTTRRSSHAAPKIPHELRPAHMDELPVPYGCWKESYDKANRKYNLQLAAGVGIFVATVAFGRATGMLWLNYSTPTPKEQ